MSVQEILNDPQKLDQIVTMCFNELDKDHSGQIEKKEIKAGLDHLGQQVGATFTEEEKTEFFKFLDQDGSGTISKKEFKDFMVFLLQNCH